MAAATTVRSGPSETNGLDRKTALITGITGQDGSYLTEFLLEKGYEVHGLIRRSSNFNTQRINHIYIDPHNTHKARMKLHYADLSDASSLRRWLDTILPDEVYNLAAQSHVAVSFEIPDYTADVVATGALRLLEAVRSHISDSGRSHIRYYQAGSSEMFGATPPPQSETTPFHPRSPYAASKVAAHWYTVNYREAYGIYACNGILFNHESPRRGENFVTRKITRAVGRIKIGLQSKLFLGNLQASRDWGFAGDYVEAMWMMLQQDKPDDYVVATEESHTVQEFLEAAFGYVNLNWKDHVVIDKRYFRPAEVDNFVPSYLSLKMSSIVPTETQLLRPRRAEVAASHPRIPRGLMLGRQDVNSGIFWKLRRSFSMVRSRTADSSSDSTMPRNGVFTVGDFMTKKEELHVVKPTTSVDEALEILVEKRITGFPVIDDNWKLVGLVSDYDLLALDSISGSGPTDTGMFPEVDSTWRTFNEVRNLLSKTNGQVVGDVMTPAPVVVRESSNLEDAARILLETKHRRLPVVDSEEKLVGIITRGNVVRAALKIKQENEIQT